MLDRPDAAHAAARRAWESMLAAKTALATTNAVVLETTALLQHRLGIEAARPFSDAICPVLTIASLPCFLHGRENRSFRKRRELVSMGWASRTRKLVSVSNSMTVSVVQLVSVLVLRPSIVTSVTRGSRGVLKRK